MKKLLCLVLGVFIFASGCSFNLSDERVVQNLPVVGNAANMKRLLKSGEQQYFGLGFRTDTALANKETTGAKTDVNSSYSTTNVQVQGIDEADVVKTDGTYLYHISGAKVLITRAWPASALGIVKELEFDKGFSPALLYVDDDYLVVVGGQHDNIEFPDVPQGRILPMLEISTRILVFDIKDKGDVTLERDVALDGYNVTSRKKDNFIYLVNSRFVGWFEDDQAPTLPWFRDSSAGGDKTVIDYTDIHYFPDGYLTDYVMFAALDLAGGELKVDTYLGWAQNIYMNHENLYLAMTDWTSTTVYRFGVNATNLDFMGKGKVSGTPLNQFSMDEYDGYFRIATTEYRDWTKTTNNVFVLNSEMKTVGKITNIAPGETIYSARFMGDKGYLVTFEMVDPLFVIDISNPRAPKILGELKIPGFSNYLHPLDDNHLLGIGMDTQVRSIEGRDFVVTRGIKLAIFDVRDVKKPKEKHVEIIGGGGTWSEALYDHKAVFFHQGVLAISADVTDGKDNSKLEFQGALFYEVDLEAGLTPLGSISHSSAGPVEDSGWYHRNPNVKRVVQIEDVYYTVSQAQVMAHSAESFKRLAKIDLPSSR